MKISESVAIVSVDPGETTGLAWGTLSGGEAWGLGDVGWEQILAADGKYWSAEVGVVMKVLGKIREMQLGGSGASVIVSEGFALTPGRVLKGRGALSPVRINAMLMFALEQKWSSAVFVEQSASRKGVINDARLKVLMRGAGEYPAGHKLRHARDALRHLMLAVRRLQKGDIRI